MPASRQSSSTSSSWTSATALSTSSGRRCLLYFDSFSVGLTATPAGKTIGFSIKNLVMQYGHDEAVTDGVNVDFDVCRIRTRICRRARPSSPIGLASMGGAPQTHLALSVSQDSMQDLTYTADELDRDVVAGSQIRTVIRQFRDRVLPDAS